MLRQGIFRFVLVIVFSAMAFCGSVREAQSCAPAQASSTPVLTNEDIVKLVEARVGDPVIIAKIKTSAAKFDTSTEALIRLKQAGVSDAVLEAMVQASGAPGSVAAVPPDPNDPLSLHDPLIWLMKNERHGKRMVQLEPTAYSQVKLGGPGRILVPLAPKSKWKAVVRGGSARVRVSEPRPTFYFYFDKGSVAAGQSSQGPGPPGPLGTRGVWLAGASSPSQFTLAKFEAKPDERELVIGEMGGLGGSITMGVASKDTVEFDFEELTAGIYKVTPRVDLQPGEYCFFYTGTGTAVGGQLFDFGVNEGR